MLNKGLFKRPKNELESYGRHALAAEPSVPDEMCVVCPSCAATLFSSELTDNQSVCMKCAHHFRLNMRQRISITLDENSFEEIDADMRSQNPIDFPAYERKLKQAFLESRENEAVVCGTAKIGGEACAVFVMEPYFMMGSMGTVVGEKITRLFELAADKKLPVIGFIVSGGARMQEGILSLMQMAKTSGAVKLHSDAGLFYAAVLTDPTTGGVTASFAMEADVIIAEKGALIGFAGPRVIEQTIRQKLPEGFQRAEFLKEKGFVDEVLARGEIRGYIIRLLKLHRRQENTDAGN